MAVSTIDQTGLSAPLSLTSPTLSSPTISGTPTGVGVLTSGTVQNSTSGTNIDFTGIPSWVKRITVMFNGVSTTGTNNPQIQLGTGATPTYTSSGYACNYSLQGSTSISTASASTGFVCIGPSNAAAVSSGQVTLTNISGNNWVETGQVAETSGSRITSSAGVIALGAVLTAVRVNVPTDTWDAGSINILYE